MYLYLIVKIIMLQVPYNDQNGWTCPDCGQYNGWNEDGDYNKILDISSQNKTRFVQGRSHEIFIPHVPTVK